MSIIPAVVHPIYAGRLIGLTCEDALRLDAEEDNLIKDGEIYFTSDGSHAFYNGFKIGSVVHGGETAIAAGEAARFALNASSERQCFAGDTCIQAAPTVADPDAEEVWLCRAFRGTDAAHWIKIKSADSELAGSLVGQWVAVSNGDPSAPGLLYDENGQAIHNWIPAADLPTPPI